MKKVGFRVLAIALLAYLIGGSLQIIGRTPSCEVFSSWDIWRGIFIISLIMFIGYQAGKEAERNN